jgi:hypothetical protein
MYARAEARMVPVGKRARVRVGGEVGLQPLLLGDPAAQPPATDEQLEFSEITCQLPRSQEYYPSLGSPAAAPK